MRLWLKLFLTYTFFLVAMILIGIFGIQSAKQVGGGFHRVNTEVVPLLGHLKDLRFAGLRIISSTVEYCFLRSSGEAGGSRQEKQEEGEKALLERGVREYEIILTLCRAEMAGSDAARDDFRNIESIGQILLRDCARLVRHARMKGSLSELFEIKEDFERSEQRFLESVSIAHNRVIGTLGQLEESAFYNITHARNNIVLLLLFCCGSTLGIAFIFTSRTTNRILVLKDAAEKVARGDLDQYVSIVPRDEIGTLSDSFNQMVTSLRESQNKLTSSYAYLESIFSSVPDILLVLDRSGRIVDSNPSIATILGHEKDFLRGSSIGSLFTDSGEATNLIDEIQTKANINSREIYLLSSAGLSIPFSLSISTLPPDQHNNLWFLCTAHNIARRKEAEEKIWALAYTDHLTGLPNRLLFLDRCAQAIALAERNKTQLALLFFDLDHFKDINDTLGHYAGDLLLKEVSNHLSKILRISNTLARLGGDEFALLCTSIRHPEDAGIVAGRIIEQLQIPFEIEGKTVFTSASVGIVIYPDDGSDSSTLLKNADLAMYAAKEQGRKTFNFFSDQLNLKAQERATIEEGLRLAMQSDQLLLHYQPQIELGSGRIFGVEALCRWLHPTLGFIAPDKFIPVAEQTGMIRDLGDWVLKTACRQCAEWHLKGFPLSMAVNVSISQLRFPDFPDKVTMALAEAGLAPEYLELEITESLLMNCAEESMEMLKRLKTIGVKIAIDDFGTGYSSLSYLNKFSLDRIKIDQSFIREITFRDDAASIVRAIVAIGHSLGLRVIAEGIETEEEQELLLKLACDEAQGYHYSKPVSAAEAGRLIYANLPLKVSLPRLG